MKKLLIGLTTMGMLLGMVDAANATLILRGTDTVGNRLIYDDDLNITWYDYTNSASDWQTQMNWASDLIVNFGGTIYDDWRLPTTSGGYPVFGYDGSTTYGYNITSSEMGHLYYTELGNNGSYDTSGTPTGCSSSEPHCLINTGDFQNLMGKAYWTGSVVPESTSAYQFSFSVGNSSYKYISKYYTNHAIAVCSGDVSAIPDTDNDGILNEEDNCPYIPNPDQIDTDLDTLGNACDDDNDNDGVLDIGDNCSLHANADQLDFDGDGFGDECDFDDDNDGINDGLDQCLNTAYGEVINSDGCSINDICSCDNEWKNHGSYVVCVSKTSTDFLTEGLIDDLNYGDIVSEAARSDCGHKIRRAKP
ncbi:MAG: thrombospondin type 3 repeat-containing protein [Desulfobulbaceae bacterium]|nr:thrombospondin type 3 repeat-containing protein [Desulfobulbaceae bacterium]